MLQGAKLQRPRQRTPRAPISPPLCPPPESLRSLEPGGYCGTQNAVLGSPPASSPPPMLPAARSSVRSGSILGPVRLVLLHSHSHRHRHLHLHLHSTLYIHTLHHPSTNTHNRPAPIHTIIDLCWLRCVVDQRLGCLLCRVRGWIQVLFGRCDILLTFFLPRLFHSP